ncbi:RagB/SusD family nutrient uptake outer membrane protein [Chitinophaga pinensis]
MKDLNTLLRSRWVTGTYADMTATDGADALLKVLRERRKELIFRGRRWTDLRRLNKDPRFAKTIVRKINGALINCYQVIPVMYFLFRMMKIELSGIEQNVR